MVGRILLLAAITRRPAMQPHVFGGFVDQHVSGCCRPVPSWYWPTRRDVLLTSQRHCVQGGAGGMLIESGRFERCPHCSMDFRDAVSLVEHVERQHALSNASTCVVS